LINLAVNGGRIVQLVIAPVRRLEFAEGLFPKRDGGGQLWFREPKALSRFGCPAGFA
jgi:hypothetical protein